jgi:hypothetical protein
MRRDRPSILHRFITSNISLLTKSRTRCMTCWDTDELQECSIVGRRQVTLVVPSMVVGRLAPAISLRALRAGVGAGTGSLSSSGVWVSCDVCFTSVAAAGAYLVGPHLVCCGGPFLSFPPPFAVRCPRRLSCLLSIVAVTSLEP